MAMVIKVCGMLYGDNIANVEMLMPDMMGFIFYPKSPRYVAELPSSMPQGSRRVGVFVNEDIELVAKIAGDYKLDLLQLHGSESGDYCRELKSRGFSLIKAFSISSESDFAATDNYKELCDYFIFDTKCASVGGSGKSFDWSLLSCYNGDTPFLLSGGVGLHNLDELKALRHDKLVGYDLNSAFELAPGLKDVDKLRLFFNKINCK